jgi:hypothetical protein
MPLQGLSSREPRNLSGRANQWLILPFASPLRDPIARPRFEETLRRAFRFEFSYAYARAREEPLE